MAKIQPRSKNSSRLKRVDGRQFHQCSAFSHRDLAPDKNGSFGANDSRVPTNVFLVDSYVTLITFAKEQNLIQEQISPKNAAAVCDFYFQREGSRFSLKMYRNCFAQPILNYPNTVLNEHSLKLISLSQFSVQFQFEVLKAYFHYPTEEGAFL